MALIKCPECGKPVSDKAATCPNCGIYVQKVLTEIREEQKQKQEKRKRRIFISIISFSVVAALSVLAYLYYIDALNSIPSEYRKQTEGYFEYCDAAISNNDFTRGDYYVNSLKKRAFTNRQAQHFEKSKMAVAKVGLCDLENMLASVAYNSCTKIDDDVLRRIKEVISILDTYQLDISQTEHLKKAKEKLAELILTAIEKRVGLQDGDRQVKYSFEVTNHLLQELQKMELSTTQRGRFEEAMKAAEKLKKPNITAKGVTPFLLGATFLNIPPQGDYYNNIILGRYYLVDYGEGGAVEITEDELAEYYDDFGNWAEVLNSYGTGVIMQGSDTMLTVKYDKKGIISEIEVFSKDLQLENGIHVGLSSETMASQYNASFLTTDYCVEGFVGMCYYVKELPRNIILWATNVYDIFDGAMCNEVNPSYWGYPTSGERINNSDCLFSYKVPMDKVKGSHLASIRILKKDYERYNP